jgi:RNA polymerase sigma-70 factor (ECF subfamily)
MTGEAVALARSGVVDESAAERLGALFDAHHGRLYRLARRMAPTAEEARDLVQETFLRAARAPHAIPSAGAQSEEAWLVRVLINLCRDGWRKRANRARLDAVSAAPPSSPSNPEQALLARATIWRALDRLAPRRRASIVLYELEGVGIAEIARLLGISAVTVRWHLSRGRKELARIIGSG